jgi:phosphatidylglycerol:prolipoprotein diacylglycerol transferase
MAQGRAQRRPVWKVLRSVRRRCQERRRAEEGRERRSPHAPDGKRPARGPLAFGPVQPEIHLGPIDLQTFGICFALGFLAAGAVLSRRLRELGKPQDWAYEMIFAALIGGLVGARVDYVIENWDKVSGDIFGNIFSGTGLVWFGGVLGGALGVILWARWRGWLGYQMCDSAAVPLAVGYAIGRIGCQLSGDGDYGIKSDVPWAMSYPDGTVPTTDEVHPTPVYETLTMGLVALILWRLRDRFAPGVLFGLYLLLAGAERFLVEFIRRNDSVVGGLTLPQLVSLAMLAAGSALVVARRGAPQPVTA